MRYGFHGTVRLPLFEGGAKPVNATVAVHVKRTWAVGDRVPIRETQNRWSHELRNDLSYQFLQSGSEQKVNSLPEERVDEAERRRQVGQIMVVIVDTAHQCTDLLQILRHRHVDRCRRFFSVRA